ncbi:hypothetical protein BLNAU_372 [Blattamonas nauphoetae]|uniref:Uncharacterized protein n=1 Tax=Blattamonas nauphoetae TaxID=2049346 RepID=A0ABQ9YL21_9EUKA|nr:hypothetical protein BLNAU_372 [Blattamonas nauphoetae]
MFHFSTVSGTDMRDFAPRPLKVIIYEDSKGFPLFESSPFDFPELMTSSYAAGRVWYLALNLYNFAVSVDVEVPKNDREVLRVVFGLQETKKAGSSQTDLYKFGEVHSPSLAGRECIGMVCTRRNTSNLCIKCFTLHDNAMCSADMINRIHSFNNAVIDRFMKELEDDLPNYVSRIKDFSETDPASLESIKEETFHRYSPFLDEDVSIYNQSLDLSSKPKAHS